MSALHWFPFYWTDYSSKTMHLSQGQHGAYMLLLRWIYTTNTPVPDKQRYSIAQARLKQEITNVDSVLAQFFVQTDGEWHNLKADEVIAGASERREKIVLAGRAGGLKRSSNAKATLKPSPSNYNHNHKDKNQKEERTAAPLAQAFVLPDFIPNQPWEDFLDMRKGAKKPATERAKVLLIRSIEKLMLSGEDPEKILNQSTMNNWTDVYPLKEKANGQRKAPSAISNFIAAGDRAVDLVCGPEDRPPEGPAIIDITPQAGRRVL